ncbi:MAG: hypothetical protein KF760_29260 [Candidatus Eremiobacteraeota bacterium]|nr:hypothetical protein [Candidatus Eremiobacteraeota bacterium]MCW5865937.1 hypothetical protein [Candidatus Eremiobacteraeota bacterium]
MKRTLAFLLSALLCGCGPAFSPDLLLKCDDLMLPPTQGLNGPNPPQVGGGANTSRDSHWSGKLLLVNMPRTPMEHARPHPAMQALDPSLKAGSDDEVGAVGFVLQSSSLNRGAPGGTGYLLVTLVDWKTRVNLGTYVIKSWKNNAPEQKDFEGAYPDLAKKLKDLHR